jgi:hypothetical protein
MTQYTLNDFSNISSSGFEYKLDDHVLNEINKIVAELGINTESRLKKHIELSKNFGIGSFKRGKSNSELSTQDESWERVRNFKATNIEKKEGVDKTINDIRTCLNKLSDANYEMQQSVIFQHISNILNTNADDNKVKEDEILKVANSLFEIASNNKFYSELYAVLYKELSLQFPIFKEIIITFTNVYLENIGKIQFVDSNKEYDKYCDNNKENDKRKALSVFLVNLMKNSLIQIDELMNIIILLQETTASYIDQENKSYEVEELTEVIYIFILTLLTNNKTNVEKKVREGKISKKLEMLFSGIDYDENNLMSLEKWMAIRDNVEKCSKFKPKEHLSISNRTIFRYMDMLDMITKKSK